MLYSCIATIILWPAVTCTGCTPSKIPVWGKMTWNLLKLFGVPRFKQWRQERAARRAVRRETKRLYHEAVDDLISGAPWSKMDAFIEQRRREDPELDALLKRGDH